MENSYFDRKRREYAEINRKIIVIKSVKTVDFKYKSDYYKYKYWVNSDSFELISIFDGNGKTIYSIYASNCTDLGKEIYEELRKQNII